MTKTISNDFYFWAHIATILFHLVVSALVLWRGWFVKKDKVLLWTGIILALISFLSLVPIIKYKNDQIIINS